MNACGFDRFDFYSCLDRVERAIAAQVRFHSGSFDLLSTFRSLPDWADNNFEQRVWRVKKAIDDSQLIAIRNLQKKLGGINLQDIWPVLAEICHNMTLYLGGGAIAGGAIGTVVGSMVWGVGAIPGAVAGTALGMELGVMLLNFIGLKSTVEYMVDSIPLAIDEYQKGFSDAWGPVPSLIDDWRDRRPLSSHFCDSGFAAEHFASGHETIVVALLMGIVAYLGRGKGNFKALLSEAQSSSRLGPKFATWLEKNAEKLTASPMLQGRRDSGGPAGGKKTQTGAKSKAAAQPAGSKAEKNVNRLEPTVGVLKHGAFAQVPAKSTKAFSEEGQKVYSRAAGRPIRTLNDLTDALKQGVVKPSQVPLDYVMIDGQIVIANTRSSTALINAKIPKDQWFGVDKTGVKAYGDVTFDDLVRNQLNKNYGGSVHKARR